MATHTSLKSVERIGQSLLTDQLEYGVTQFLQWGMLGVGGFCDVRLNEAGQYGGNESRLRLVDDPHYSAGRVWEGFRRDWVWEQGVEYERQPIAISGVYVDGTFQPATGVGTYAHHIDYPNGRVVFDAAIPRTSVVTCEYSYRQYHFTTSDAPWWREFQENTLRVEDSQFLQQASGVWDTLSQSRIQLPAVVVDVDWRTDRRPFEIGNQKQTVSQDVVFHIVGEEKMSVKQMHDILTYQQDKRIIGVDKNLVFANDAYPLDMNGTPKPTAIMYPDMVETYPWEQIRFTRTRSFSHSKQPPLYYAEVRVTFEVDLP